MENCQTIAKMKLALFVLSALCVSASLAKPSTRLIGGVVARAGQFPFAAAIYATHKDGTYFCSGALINDQWIVTAAHSIQGAISFTIQLGSNKLKGTDDNRLTLSTDTWVVHPDFDPATQNNDVGLIKLRMPITFSTYLRPINLPNVGLHDDEPVAVLGWGQVDDEHSGLVNDLQYVELTTISNPECALFYGSQITSQMVCAAGNMNQGTCNGDMGAPLIHQRGGLYIVGVASFLSGNGCESYDPSGFVRLYSFVPWINNVTSSDSL